MSIRVLLVDDHTMLREALRIMLDKEPGIEVVGELGDGSGVAEAHARLMPDVIVMDGCQHADYQWDRSDS